jgi:phosphoglycerate kinase
MKYNLVQNLDVQNKTVVVRTDINVPLKNGVVQDSTRIKESFTTIKHLLEGGAKKVIIVAHFGRPKGKVVQEMSFKYILSEVQKIYGQNVDLLPLEEEGKIQKSLSKIILIENIRFYPEEEKNGDAFSQTLAKLGDFYINDAFSASHRAHSSVYGVAKYTKVYAGLLLQDEIFNIESILNGTQKEKICTIIGGSKVSTKLDLLNNLIHKSKYIILGGGMANTFFHAKGFAVGKSLFEPDFTKNCVEILKKAKEIGTQILLPEFVITAKEFKDGAEIEVKNIKNISEDDIITDVYFDGELEDILQKVNFVVWNGPLGAFETKPFSCGTESTARLLAKYTALKNIKSIIGGGDVVSAIGAAGLKNSMTYISTGGGAFLEWLEGKTLPGITVCKVNV